MYGFLIIAVLLMIVTYAYFTRNFDYWKKRGVFYLQPLPFVGNTKNIVFLKLPIGRFLHDIYTKYPKEPYVGIFFGNKPCLVIRDSELAVKMLTKDFDHFNQRIFGPTADLDPLGAKSLFALHGTEWKNSRSNLSRGFTGLKLRVMYDFILATAKQVEEKISKDGTLEAKNLFSSFSTDTIATAVLGISGNALAGRKDVLQEISNGIFNDSLISGLKSNLAFLSPQLFQLFRTAIFPAATYRLMREVVWKAVKLREDGLVNRDDFLGTLLELRKKRGWDIGHGQKFELEGDHLVSQLFLFLTAGFETSSTALVFCMYQLAINQHVQDQLRREIRQTLPEGGDGDVGYDALTSMKYLDMVIHESLRMHPPFPFLDRRCTKDYKLLNGLVIEKDTYVMVPMLGIHHDEKYWPNPEKFDPERFRNAEDYAGKPYMPFSNGPRTCLGRRFALLEMKAVITCSLRNHKLLLNKNVPEDIGFNPRRFGNVPKADIFLDVVRV